MGSGAVRFWESNLTKWVEMACLMEVMTPKPGNVFPGQEFHDCCVEDFVRSARVIAPILAKTRHDGVGRAILNAVKAAQATSGTNTNLGIVLLIAPLAAVGPERSLSEGIADVLEGLTDEDAHNVYQAIRQAEPGGLGSSSEQDVSESPTATLVECMRLAADRDLVARQYVSLFEDVLTIGRIGLREARVYSPRQSEQIGAVALRLLACEADSLITRKCGREMSEMISDKAASIVAAGWPHTAESKLMWNELDGFLRADGNQRNPGTTADVTAAALFAGLREGCIAPQDDWWKPNKATA
jgi:triphosphoribosyl-dephospho-CoA synthase